VKHTTISSSDGTSLVFPDREILKAYEKDELLLKLRYYKRIRDKYGIWASNQGKFVGSPGDLNDWDGRKMEMLLAMHVHELSSEA
jgi:hypothetical protein